MAARVRRRGRRAVSVRACAKINLTLRVLGTRPDGYHELRTVFQTLALHDTLTFREAVDAPLSIECADPACPRDQRNLVWKAAELLWRAAGRSDTPGGVTIRIVKRIPSQAGLGGASSDAFAALRGLAAFWNLPLDPSLLEELAGAIGSDVAFFTLGGRALGIGRGECVFPLVDGPARWVALAVPPFGISTVEAYRWCDEWVGPQGTAVQGNGDPVEAVRWARATGLRLPGGEWTNDLQAPVAARHPALSGLVRLLRDTGAAVSAMSGSGSVVYGLFETRAAALRGARAVTASGSTALVTETLGRAAYQRLVRPAAGRGR